MLGFQGHIHRLRWVTRLTPVNSISKCAALAATPTRPLPSTSCGDRRQRRSMNWNATCAARTAPRFGAIPIRGAIWSRCASARSRRAIRHRHGGRVSGEREGGRMKLSKKALPLLAIFSSPCCRTASVSDTSPKRKPLRAYSPLKSAAKALLAIIRRRPRAMRSVKAGLRGLGSNVHEECHLQNRPISRSGGKGGKTEIGPFAWIRS